jgi:pimeloyl-ACP methyl ester carboxylesterase
MTEGHFFVRLSDGALVRCRVDGPPKAPRMLIYNGLVSSGFHWRHWVEHYRKSYAVISWDYRGHGPYEGRHDLGRVSIPSFARDGHEVLAAAGGPPAILCGISMGVQVALEHLRHHPRDASALILLCGTSGHPLNRLRVGPLGRRFLAWVARKLSTLRPVASAILAPFLGTRLGRELAYLSGGARRGYLPPEFLEEIFAHVRRIQPRVVGAITASWITHTAEDLLDKVPVPTLIFAGGADQLTPPVLARTMKERIPDAELWVVDGHSHLLQVERPDLVHRHADEWLARKGL